ncbi:hypothetical protein CPB83DRAFT_841944 [Crepidotus variabilis]|uniref:t-SNARE coiled-coil homology domain-containing protein n=1 Tax=Crepidotus variabilis TaxID=179855 RepID=A0A9P6ESV6_9AGAR|nr:hypothetical protein CPB83DRAFT_841944 [Crepidotus variabilis]
MSQRIRAAPSLRDRSALLGTNSQPSSGHSTPFGGRTPPNGFTNQHPQFGTRYADDLEGQNDEALEGLSAKVKLLKDISIGIGNEVKESAVQLSQMNDAFAETGGILSGTFRRMNKMAQRQGCRWLWYIVFLVIVFWFFMVVWWFRK